MRVRGHKVSIRKDFRGGSEPLFHGERRTGVRGFSPVQDGSEALEGGPDCKPLGHALVSKGVALEEVQYEC